jgi:hypothetical protein
MQKVSPSIAGADYGASRPFAFAFNGSAGADVAKTAVRGSYTMHATVDCYVRWDGEDVEAFAAAQPTTAVKQVKLFAGEVTAIDFTEDVDLSVLGAGTDGGTLTIQGPLYGGLVDG